METTLGAVLARRALELRHLAGRLDADRRIRWVAVSELADPTPYLEGGELLLTTGLELPVDDPPAVLAYVERLARRGVVALGLGTGLRHSAPPEPLLTAVEAVGLPLLEVPPPTPFIAVTRAVADLVAQAEREDVTRTLDAHRRLTRAALRPDGRDAVVRELARLLDGWAVVADATGAVVRAAGEIPEPLRAGVAEQIVRLVPQGLRGSAAVSGADGTFVVYPLGTSGRPHWYVAAGRRVPFDVPGRGAVTTCVSLLSLSLQRADSAHAGQRPARRAAADLLVDGRADAADAVLQAFGAEEHRAAEGLTVLVADAPPDGEDAVPQIEEEIATVGALLTCRAGELVAMVPAPGAAVDAVAGVLREHGGVVGVSRPVRRGEVPRAVEEARSARALGPGRGDGVVRFTDLVADGLPALVDEATARRWADARLAPLRDHAEGGGSVDLVRSLRVYLAHHGQWQPAAAELGVHRHTLRYRMARVEHVLGTSLDSPQTRMNLWFALQAAGG